MSISTRMTGQERRQAIIEAAVKLFSERGFRGVTTREIAAEVGVTEPVLYQHFPSKRDLYRAMIERKIEQSGTLFDRFHTICQSNHAPREFFIGLGMLIVDWHLADSSFLRLMIHARLEGNELTEIVHERMFENYHQTLMDAVARQMKSEPYREVDPEIAAYAFCSMISHHCLHLVLFKHCVPVQSNEEIVQSMVDIFLHGITKGTK